MSKRFFTQALATHMLAAQVLSLSLILCISPLIAVGPTIQENNPTIPKDYAQIKCTITPIDRNSHHRTHPRIPLGGKSELLGYSTNWSGYVAETNLTNPATNSVTAVSASWIVPTIKPSTGKTYCAIWVGIDGYSNSTVEQIGTEHDWSSGTVQHYAWFEMYPGGSYSINGFPLNSGDVISASVAYSSKNVFTMCLSNQTQKVATTIPTQYTTSTTAKRQSAEWIIEAPYMNSILPLANFGTVYMANCKATIKGISGLINNTAWANSPIEMITNSGAPKDIPSIVGSGSFSATWQHQ